MWQRIKKNPKLILALVVATPGSGLLVFALLLTLWEMWRFVLVAIAMGSFVWAAATIIDELSKPPKL